jgi:multidrug efflux pump subunit AcrA (membrane-fusion protein)
LVLLAPTGHAGGAPLAARVRAVSPLVDPATGRVRVEVEASGAGIGLSGATVRARLDGGAGGAGAAAGTPTAAAGAGAGAILPRDAALERVGEDFFVFRVAGGRVAKTRVELGASRSDGYEVVSGLAAGDLVCAAGEAALPADGARVRPRLVAGAD